MNYLATINTGDFMCQNVRDSFQHAAKRWGVEYVEITQPFAAGTHPFQMKLELPMYNWAEASRVFFAEGDVLIRDDCPNPFGEVQHGTFAAVLNDQGELDGVVNRNQRLAWGNTNYALSKVFEKPIIPYRGAYFNTGVFMFEPARHAAQFASALNLYNALKPYGGDDQTILSMMIQAFNTPVHILDRRWNCVGPKVWKMAPIMPAWITHYAKYCEYRDGRDEKLKAAVWNPFPDMPPDGTRWENPNAGKQSWIAEVRGRRVWFWETANPKRVEVVSNPIEAIITWDAAGYRVPPEAFEVPAGTTTPENAIMYGQRIG